MRALALAAMLALAPAPAMAGQVEEADRTVKAVRLSYVEPLNNGRVYVETNDGATYQFGSEKGCKRFLSARNCRLVFRP